MLIVKKEAKRKFWALKENGKYDGEIVCKINATKQYNFIKSIYQKIKNVWNSN